MTDDSWLQMTNVRKDKLTSGSFTERLLASRPRRGFFAWLRRRR